MAMTGSNLSAQAIWDQIATKKRQDEDAARAAEAIKQAERDAVRDSFKERVVQPEAMDRIAVIVARAIENGEKRALVLQFPSEWLPDSGRAVTSRDPNWHEHLDGFPQRAYEFFQKELAPRGFQLMVEILDWPGGMPGDVGWFLTWKHPDEA